MCLDCPEYQTGGYCRHKHKDVGALSPACDYAEKMNKKFNPEDEDAPLEQAKPEERQIEYKSEPVGPKVISPAEAERRAERNQRRREARAAKRPLPEKIDHKVCKHCGRDLPFSEYYLKDGKPGWLCKTGTKAYAVEKAKAKRDAESARLNAGATTRVCKTCGREQPLDAFGKHRQTWDGKATVCKDCMVKKLTKNKEKNGSECVRIILDESAPTPAPVLDENIKTVKAPPADEPILLADIDTSASLENFESKRLVEELRARGYTVTCSRPITVIEEL